MNKKTRNTSIGLIGLAGVVIFGLSWLFASLIDTSWVFGTDMLSDLGVSYTDAKYYFNYGAFISGVLIMIAGIGITSFRRGGAAMSISGLGIAIAGLFLALIGLFPSDTEYHDYFAIALFAAGLLAMVIMTAGDWQQKRHVSGGISLIILAVIVVTFMMDELAMAEAVATIGMMFWLALTMFKVFLIKEKK